MNLRSAVSAIEKHGMLLVYPIDNRKEPISLWSVFYPKSPMRWEWDESGDDRVAKLWHLREELSRSRKVVYAKWYRGRATFFSTEIFKAMLSILGSNRGSSRRSGPGSIRGPGPSEGVAGLSREARQILEALEFDSPLSTKELKRATDLRGRALESTYEKAMKELWSRLLIVGFGEIDDGAFPSLAVGASRVLFEDLWNESLSLSPDEAWEMVREKIPSDSLFLKQLNRSLSSLSGEAAPESARRAEPRET